MHVLWNQSFEYQDPFSQDLLVVRTPVVREHWVLNFLYILQSWLSFQVP